VRDDRATRSSWRTRLRVWPGSPGARERVRERLAEVAGRPALQIPREGHGEDVSGDARQPRDTGDMRVRVGTALVADARRARSRRCKACRREHGEPITPLCTSAARCPAAWSRRCTRSATRSRAEPSWPSESVDELAFLLGHKDANATRAVYAHEIADARRRALRRRAHGRRVRVVPAWRRRRSDTRRAPAGARRQPARCRNAYSSSS
jgi:integrase